jgi:hypothetical protein
MGKNYLVKDRYQFRYGGTYGKWNDVTQITQDNTPKPVKLYHIETGVETQYANTREAIRSNPKFKRTTFKRRLKNKNISTVPYEGYLIKYADDNTDWEVGELYDNYNRGLVVTDPYGNITNYQSARKCTEATGIPSDSIWRRLNGSIETDEFQGYKFAYAA